MPRTIIDIPTEQLREVDGLCALLNISRAEAVRQGLRQFIERNAPVRTGGFALWKNAGRSREQLLTDLRKSW
jgi:hypothetical protein